MLNLYWASRFGTLIIAFLAWLSLLASGGRDLKRRKVSPVSLILFFGWMITLVTVYWDKF